MFHDVPCAFCPAVLSHQATEPCATPQRGPVSGVILGRERGRVPQLCDGDGAEGQLPGRAIASSLQQREKRTPATATPACVDLRAVTGHVFVSLTVWPWGRCPLRPLLPWPFLAAAALPASLQSQGAGSLCVPQHAAGGAPSLGGAVPGCPWVCINVTLSPAIE